MPVVLPTIAAALREAAQRGLERIDAQLLLLHALGQAQRSRAWLIAHDEQTLTPAQQTAFAHLLAQRQRGVPVAYLTGRKGFFGLELAITPDVLDPRPDTETLVEWALQTLAPRTNPSVWDLGTGSGAIALAIKSQRPDARVWASDQSASALAVARQNGQALGLQVHWLQGSWFDAAADDGQSSVQSSVQSPPLPGAGQWDVLVSNPPYIAAADPHLPALAHEPRQALVSGADGLADIRAIARAAPTWLTPGGWLLLEHGWDQASAVAAILAQAGLRHISHRCDLAGHARCTGGMRE
ncbi:MAG: peptide chain release factor N(5)-glutamine methyltransferase [Comamonadaceae bacterium]|nr:peptide chain release factor N(5)-glutamine methyltransferase [Comamonadaceae bacterium]